MFACIYSYPYMQITKVKQGRKEKKMENIEHLTVATNGISMHVASIGKADSPVILFIHGFPELWYSWRHQLLSLSSLGYRCIAPDLRGYGDTVNAPTSVSEYTVLHAIGDLVGLLDSLRIEQVYLVGHDWGAMISWHFCQFRPDRIKALVNTSVSFMPRHPQMSPVELCRALFGDDYYIQEPGEAEQDFAKIDTPRLFRKLLSARESKPPCVPKEIGFVGALPDPPSLPDWLTEEDISYYASKFDQSGFTGGLNYYRALNLTWKLTAAWTGKQVNVPTKFIIGDQDITYNIPGAKQYIHDGGFKKDVPLLQEVVVMEGVGHFLNQEKPEEVSKHIYDFVKKF